MRKFMIIALVCICVLGNVGCSQPLQQVQGNQLFADENVIRIDVSSLPEGYNDSFSGEDANAIMNYLSNLTLERNFEENPNEYGGMTWVISLNYEDGDIFTIYHFGNMFIRFDNGPWYKMTYAEASRFDVLLNERNN